MQIPRPPVVGQESVARRLRPVLFSEPIVAAAYVWPPGFLRDMPIPFVPFWIQLLMKPSRQPVPKTLLCLAVTPVDVRLFAAPSFGDVYEVLRWKKGTYRARTRDSLLAIWLDVDADASGRITLMAFRTGSRIIRPVFDLVLQGANGPVL